MANRELVVLVGQDEGVGGGRGLAGQTAELDPLRRAHCPGVSRNEAGSAYHRDPGTCTSPERSPSRRPISTHSFQ